MLRELDAEGINVPDGFATTSIATFLVQCGIDSISVTPDSFFEVKANVADAEQDQSLWEVTTHADSTTVA